jgi:hypothetical protein
MDMHHILYNFLKSDQQKNLTSFLPDPLLAPTILAGRPNIPRGCGLFHFPRFFVDPLSEPHAGAPAVLSSMNSTPLSQMLVLLKDRAARFTRPGY